MVHERICHKPCGDLTPFYTATVDHKSQETIAINAAKEVKGVKEVKSQLTIRYND